MKPLWPATPKAKCVVRLDWPNTVLPFECCHGRQGFRRLFRLHQVMSPVSSPHAVPPHGPAGNVASPPYPCSPTAASTPPGMSAIPWTCLYFCPAMLILWYSMPLLLRTQAASGSWRSCPAWLQRHVSLPKCPCLCELASVRPFLCSDAQDTSAEARWARHHPCSLAPQAPLAVQLLPLHLARRPWELPEPTCTPIAVEHCRLSCLRSAAACCLWSPCATCKASKPAGVPTLGMCAVH